MYRGQMVTEIEISKVWGNARFGGKPDDKVGIVMNATLKMLAGWHTGHTAYRICVELGLVTEKRLVTPKGKFCLYEHFHTNNV